MSSNQLAPAGSVPLENNRHELFVLWLLRGKSGDEAYQLAGFKPNRGNASRLKSNDIIQARLDYLQAEVAERVAAEEHATKAEILRRDTDQALFDPFDVFTYQPGSGILFKDMESIPVEARRCIASVQDTKDGVSVKFHSPHPSIERLAKYHGIVGNGAVKQIEEQVSPEDAYEHSLQAASWLEEFSMKHGLNTVDQVVALLRTKHE